MKDQSPHLSGQPGAATDAKPPVPDLQRPPSLSHGVPAWLLSFLLHAALLVSLGFMVRVAHRGAPLESARGGGIVLARDVEGTSEYFGEGEQNSSETAPSSEASETLPNALPSGSDMSLDLPGALPEGKGAPPGAVNDSTLPSAEGLTEGSGLPSRGSIAGNQAKTSIFGAEGVGSKFVYVFDRSASMDGFQGRPLRAAKDELTASLSDLEKVHQFQIVFYNDHATVFNPHRPEPPRMLFGEAQQKRLAQNYVRGVVAAGGTEHMEALRLAIGMEPDVIFFLTDAAEPQLSPDQLETIRRLNSRVGASIHAIEFGAGPRQGGLNFLKRMASQNGGSHVYVDVTRLPSD